MSYVSTSSLGAFGVTPSLGPRVAPTAVTGRDTVTAAGVSASSNPATQTNAALVMLLRPLHPAIDSIPRLPSNLKTMLKEHPIEGLFLIFEPIHAIAKLAVEKANRYSGKSTRTVPLMPIPGIRTVQVSMAPYQDADTSLGVPGRNYVRRLRTLNNFMILFLQDPPNLARGIAEALVETGLSTAQGAAAFAAGIARQAVAGAQTMVQNLANQLPPGARPPTPPTPANVAPPPPPPPPPARPPRPRRPFNGLSGFGNVDWVAADQENAQRLAMMAAANLQSTYQTASIDPIHLAGFNGLGEAVTVAAAGASAAPALVAGGASTAVGPVGATTAAGTTAAGAGGSAATGTATTAAVGTAVTPGIASLLMALISSGAVTAAIGAGGAVAQQVASQPPPGPDAANLSPGETDLAQRSGAGSGGGSSNMPLILGGVAAIGLAYMALKKRK